MKLEEILSGLLEGKSYTRKSMRNISWSYFPITYSGNKDCIVDKIGCRVHNVLNRNNIEADDWMEVETPEEVLIALGRKKRDLNGKN